MCVIGLYHVIYHDANVNASLILTPSVCTIFFVLRTLLKYDIINNDANEIAQLLLN